MLRTFLLAAFTLFGIQSLFAQNLVPNGSFETYEACPDNSGQIGRTGNWYQHTSNCTPDFYHACGFPGPMQVPTLDDTIYAFDGDGMARIYLYSNFDREYISTRLVEPLLAGHEYAFSVHIRLWNDELRMVGSIGAFFSQDSLTGFLQTCEPMVLTPQLQRDPNDIMDQEGIWYHWQDTLMALGGEEYINLGNFLNNAETPVIGTPFGTALYLLDDVQLVELVTVGLQKPQVEFSISPNPAQEVVRFQVQGSDNQRLTVFNPIGQEVFKQQLSSSLFHLNISTWPPGVYVARIGNEEGERVKKLVIQ